MFTISKRFEFSASHILEGLPEGHQCGRHHGHNYIVEIELQSEGLDDTGFVYDYGKLKPMKQWIDDTLDHRHLNDIVVFQPSAEHLAMWIHSKTAAALQLPEGVTVSAIRVHETPKTCAEYRP